MSGSELSIQKEFKPNYQEHSAVCLCPAPYFKIDSNNTFIIENNNNFYGGGTSSYQSSSAQQLAPAATGQFVAQVSVDIFELFFCKER